MNKADKQALKDTARHGRTEVRAEVEALVREAFFKQWGEHNEASERVGKKAAGSLLDGVEHKAFPA